MTRRAMKCGAAGAVLDGYSRDRARGVLASGFSGVFPGLLNAQDQGPRGKVLDYRVPIEMQGVRIEPGDILFGDMDGVCVVPKAAEQEVFVRALEKGRAEKSVARALDKGMTLHPTLSLSTEFCDQFWTVKHFQP